MEEFKKTKECIFPREPYDLSKERASTTSCKVATPNAQCRQPRELYELLIVRETKKEEHPIPISERSILIQRIESLAIGTVGSAFGELALEPEIGDFLPNDPYYGREESIFEPNNQFFGMTGARVKKNKYLI